ncbi:MAG: AAA family ATPase [Clostridiales bacterium]|nr:AAA family ATPase [Clostridiales bacterium]
MDIDALRGEINKINEELLVLLEKRLQLCRDIALEKAARNTPVLNEEREAEILEAVRRSSKPGLSEYNAELFSQLMRVSRKYQNDLLFASGGEMKCGLIGKTLVHSWSKPIHKALGDYSYELYSLAEDEVEAFVREKPFTGMNVTIPYKEKVLPLCNTVCDTVKKTGSVNTLIKSPDGSICGCNTDYEGFLYMVKRSGIVLEGKKILVLGSGGASKTVCAAARNAGAREIIVISRRGENNYENLAAHSDAQVIVNATPVGMYPENGAVPVSLDMFEALEGVIDLVYNPLRTRLVLEARQRGIKCTGGLEMLVSQASASAKLFGGDFRSDTDFLVKQFYESFGNLVLVGMPGSGKTTIGAEVAARMGVPFYDTDRLIELAYSMSVPEIFEKHGEKEFRRAEKEIIAQAGKRNGCVIAVGGGAVLDRENYYSLAGNGTICFLECPLEELETEGRPLSGNMEALEKMYEQRWPLYMAFADFSVKNDDAVRTVCARMRSGYSSHGRSDCGENNRKG